MKSKFLFTILVVTALSTIQNSFCQTKFLVQAKPDGSTTWGYADQTGKMIINAQYSKCYPFTKDGFAAIYDSYNRIYHFIDTTGRTLKTEITDFKINDGLGFDIEGFSNGLVAIKANGKWGYLNTSGKLAIPLKYDEASEFNSGVAVTKISKKFIVINTSGEEFEVTEPTIIEVKHFSENLAPYRSISKSFGFIGKDGKIAILAQYESVGYFVNGLAWAKKNGFIGFINPNGEWVIKPQFTAAKSFDAVSGLARIKIGETWAYTNIAGELTYVKDTEHWGDFSDGLAEGKRFLAKGFYNAKGEWVIMPQFEGTREFKNGFAAVKRNGKWGMINTKGEWVIQPTFATLRDLELIK